ncbi:MAG: type VII secretion protein EccB [Nocardioidaceae bacterium]
MATKRDLVEAHAFSRRRLVTAFVSGAPGGREVEPVRPGRTIVGGLALSVLLVLGAVIAGVFAPRTPEDWNKVGLVVSKDDGGLYVVTEQSDHPVLRPVINVTSAKLILGDLATDPTPLSSSFIQSQHIAEDVGILGAPHDVPDGSRLLGTGWTACTDSGSGIRVDVSEQPDVVPTPEAAVLVRSEGAYYLLAEAAATDDDVAATAFRFRLPVTDGVRDNMLDALGLPSSAEALDVSPAWLGLFPAGGDLSWQSMGIEGAGALAPYAGGVSGFDPASRIGDIVDLDNGSSFVLVQGGPAPLSPFARAIYANLPPPYTPDVRTAASTTMGRQRPPYAEAHWPEQVPEPAVGEACVRLEASADAAPRVRLVGQPGPAASVAGVPEGQTAVRVDPGAGAFVVSGGWDAQAVGSPFLMDAKGRAYPLLGRAAAQLGFGDLDPVHVPDSWAELFADGVPLSPEAALCPPESGSGQACQ